MKMKNHMTGRWFRRAVKWMALLLMTAILLPDFFYEVYSIFDRPVIEYAANSSADWVSLPQKGEINQKFMAKGSILSHLSIYLKDNIPGEMLLSIEDKDRNVLETIKINPEEYPHEEWSALSLNCDGLHSGQWYTLHVKSEDCLHTLGVTGTSTAPEEIPAGILENGTGTVAAAFSFLSTDTQSRGMQIIQAALNFGAAALILAVLIFSVFHAEKLFDAFRSAKSQSGFLTALFFALLFTEGTSPTAYQKNRVSVFRRVIGIGLMQDQDVGVRIQEFGLWFISFGLILVLFYLFIHFFIQKNHHAEAEKIKGLLSNVSIVAVTYILLKSIVFFERSDNQLSVYGYSEGLLALLLGALIIYIVFDLEKKVSAETFEQLLLISFCASIPLAMSMQSPAYNDKILLSCHAILAVLCVLLPTMLIDFRKNLKITVIIRRLVFPFSLIPFLTSFFIELVYILNQYSVFVEKPDVIYAILTGSWMILSVVLCIFLPIDRADFPKWKAWSFPAVLTGITCLSVQLAFSAVYQPHIFESANAGILISDFLNYGKIPLVEHYGGHMMTKVWEGILYGIVNNGDVVGASLSPYGVYVHVLYAILFYWFVRSVWDEEGAFLTACFIPYGAAWDYFGIAMLTCMALLSYVRKSTVLRAHIFWLACIWVAVYRLDLGAAFILAAVMAATIFFALKRDVRPLKTLSVSFLVWAILGTALWCILCTIKGINPITRLVEFIEISNSNTNWAYTGIGNSGTMAYAWFYLLMPFTMLICLIYMVCVPKCRVHMNRDCWLFLLIFGIAYFTNFQRGLVRHSMYEWRFEVVAWSSYLFLAGFFSFCSQRPKVFLPLLMGFVVLQGLFQEPSNFEFQANIESAAGKSCAAAWDWKYKRSPDDTMTYWEKLKKDQIRVQRVILDSEMQNLVDSYRNVLDVLLDEDETYVDYVNATVLYSLLEREAPMYVSQSPLQLSGEHAQEQFIEEIRGIPIIVMGPASAQQSLDGIPNDYHYYKVAEYIWQNYVPLLQDAGGGFSLWCIEDRYDEMRDKLEIANLEDWNSLYGVNCSIEAEEGKLVVTANAPDPQILNLENMLDIQHMAGKRYCIQISYQTDVPGMLQLFYTTEEGEGFSEGKSLPVHIEESGIAVFPVNVTECTRLRLDTPEESQVTFKDCVVSLYPLIDYRYEAAGGDSAWHTYPLYSLPYLWGEKDAEQACNNAVVSNPEKKSDYFYIDSESYTPSADGNYIHMQITYHGTDTHQGLLNKEETTEAALSLRNIQQSGNQEVCRFHFTVYEGSHHYLIRTSSDYHWYLQDFNAAAVESDSPLYNVQLKILEGD